MRDDSLSVPRQPIEAVFPLPEFRARLLHPDVAQVTYNRAVIYDGVIQHARRSWMATHPERMGAEISPTHTNVMPNHLLSPPAAAQRRQVINQALPVGGNR